MLLGLQRLSTLDKRLTRLVQRKLCLLSLRKPALRLFTTMFGRLQQSLCLRELTSITFGKVQIVFCTSKLIGEAGQFLIGVVSEFGK